MRYHVTASSDGLTVVLMQTQHSINHLGSIVTRNSSAVPDRMDESNEHLSRLAKSFMDADAVRTIAFFIACICSVALVLLGCWLQAWRLMNLDRYSLFGSAKRYASVRSIGEATPTEAQVLPPGPERTQLLGEEGLPVSVAAAEADCKKEPPTISTVLLNMFNLLLFFVPLGWLAHFLHWGDAWSFVLNFIAILPLASLTGDATEELACHTGQTIGGLLNATFGNVVELILVVQSLRLGLVAVAKATLLGSILANELLVLGMAFLYGGLLEKGTHWAIAKNKQQSFSQVGGMIQAQLLLFAAFVMVMPSMFEKENHVTAEHVLEISRYGSGFVLSTYMVYMIFQLHTHRELVAGEEEVAWDGVKGEEEAHLSAESALLLLVLTTIVVAVNTEFLVHSIEGFTNQVGFSKTFVGVVLLPIVGNACEHSTAVFAATRNKIDLSIGIALGSSIQMSLFVVPLAVLVGWGLHQPMDLNFSRFNAWALVLSALLVACVLAQGRSNWLNGFVLVVSYAVLALLFFFSPDEGLL